MADNCENTIRAGKISGSPVNGLCDRICIQVDRVYDGCITRYPSLTFQLQLTNITPGLTYPYNFINAVSSGTASFINQTVVPLEGGRIRVSGDLSIPIVVTFSDAAGQIGTGNSTVIQHRDVILKHPSRSLVPYSIDVTANFGSDVGTFLNETTVSIVCCIVSIIKVIIKSDILVPSYGYSVYPDCSEGTEDICSSLLNMPLFPPIE